jgi:hypothetical protein
MFKSPDIVGLKKINKTVALPDVAAASTITIDVVLDGNVLLLGVPEVSVDNTLLVTQIVNGGENKITVAITNTDGATTVSGANLSVIAYVVKGL